MSVYIDDRQPSATFGLLSFRRRWQLIVACIALSAALGLAFVALRPASYTASTQLQVYVREIQPGPDLVVSLGRADLTQVQNESEIARARSSLGKVVRSLHLTDDPEFASTTAPVPGISHGIAQWLFALFGAPQAATDENRSRHEDAVEALGKRVAVKRVGTSHTILINVTTSDPEKSARIANAISQTLLQGRLATEQDGDRSPLLRERLRGLGPSAFVMTPALAPDRPDGPRKILVILAAIAAGLMIGAAVALLLDFNDKTIRTARQVERFGLECIGAIPLLKRRQATDSSRIRPARQHGGGNGLLATPLLDQTLMRATVAIEAAEARIVGVASPTAGEGATTVARLLAEMAARSQRQVLLVELGERDGQGPPTGQWSVGPGAFPDAQPGPSHSGQGRLAAEAQSYGDQSANTWIHCDRKTLVAYDLIVVSLPPLERGSEFRMLAQTVDGVLLVMKWGGAEIERVERAIAVSGAAPSDFIGAVFNMVDDRMIGRFGDKLWEAEASLAARRPLFGPAMPTEPVAA